MSLKFVFFFCELIVSKGFHIFTNSFDGFAGYATRFMQLLREDYPKQAMAVFGINSTCIVDQDPEVVLF